MSTREQVSETEREGERLRERGTKGGRGRGGARERAS